MNVREEKKLRKLLEGRLSAAESRRFLDDMKDREEFRERIHFAAAAVPTSSYEPQAGPRYQSYSWSEVEAARRAPPVRRMRWVAFSLFMVVFLTIVGMMKTGQADDAPPSLDVLARDTLARGIPHLLHPAGEFDSLPRIFEVLLPPGTELLTIRINHDGQRIYEREFRRGEPGVELHLANGEAEGASYGVLQAIVPFPSTGELRLERGTLYEWISRADQGLWSAPREILISPADR